MDGKNPNQHNSQYPERRTLRQRNPPGWGFNRGIAVLAIVITCVIVFILEQVNLNAMSALAMWPDWPMPWMFVTSIFMHDPWNVSHIFWNMFILFMFGITLERMIGSKLFLILFLLAGIVGNIGYVIYCVATGSTAPALGASGAIYGVFACLALLAPDIKVYLFMFVPMPIYVALIIYAAVDVLFMGADDSVAHAAHLAGLAVGLAFALYLKKKLRERQAYSVSYEFQTGY